MLFSIDLFIFPTQNAQNGPVLFVDILHNSGCSPCGIAAAAGPQGQWGKLKLL
jgi:hypothetical protein